MIQIVSMEFWSTVFVEWTLFNITNLQGLLRSSLLLLNIFPGISGYKQWFETRSLLLVKIPLRLFQTNIRLLHDFNWGDMLSNMFKMTLIK